MASFARQSVACTAAVVQCVVFQGYWNHLEVSENFIELKDLFIKHLILFHFYWNDRNNLPGYLKLWWWLLQRQTNPDIASHLKWKIATLRMCIDAHVIRFV